MKHDSFKCKVILLKQFQIIDHLSWGEIMWKLLLSATLFLSASCFAYNDFGIIHEQEFEKSENRMVVVVDQIEDLISDLNRSSSSKPVKIWFVNNTNPNPGNGSFKNPFNTLLAAQFASEEGDIIFVFPGNNTTTGMDQGFVMKDRQRLLGAGVDHEIDFSKKKLIVQASSTTLPLLTNSTNGNGVTLADSCEVSGFHILNIRGGDAILGGDNNPVTPQTPGIKSTLIVKNIISNMNVLNGAIYLPNCTGKLVIKDNLIFNIQPINSRTGIQILNENLHVTSHVIIKKNVVSNNAFTGITVSHNSPSGSVRATVEDNIVFNIGTQGDGIFVGTQGAAAGGKVCAEIENNLCQNVVAHDLNIQSSGSAHVKAKIKENTLLVSTLQGFIATALDSSHLCLKLVKNISDNGYFLNQMDLSKFKLEPLKGNIGLPFTTSGTIIDVAADKCSCD